MARSKQQAMPSVQVDPLTSQGGPLGPVELDEAAVDGPAPVCVLEVTAWPVADDPTAALLLVLPPWPVVVDGRPAADELASLVVPTGSNWKSG